MAVPYALFCDATWQFVSLAMGGFIRTGIQRSELEASARLIGIEMSPAIFADVRVMEQEALSYWARKG